MSRLIDAEELIEIVQGTDELLDFQKDELVACIDACDIAFDLDKVIAKLEEQLAFYEGIANDESQDMNLRKYHKWIGLGVGYALDTVRNGGKE